MKTPHKHAALIKAWADGAEVEIRNGVTDRWRPIEQPAWYENYEYRVKPTARTVTILDGIATTEDGGQVDLNALQKHLYEDCHPSLPRSLKNLVFQQNLRHLTGKVWLDGDLVDA